MEVIIIAVEMDNDILAIVIKAAKLSQSVFLESIQATLEQIQSRKSVSGKQTLDQLISDGSALQNIEVSDKNIKSFEESAKAYGVDYALKKLPDKENPTYVVFFKGKNAEQVQRAFKHYAYKCTHSKDRPSVTREIKNIQQEQNRSQQRQRTRENIKDRGMEH